MLLVLVWPRRRSLLHMLHQILHVASQLLHILWQRSWLLLVLLLLVLLLHGIVHPHMPGRGWWHVSHMLPAAAGNSSSWARGMLLSMQRHAMGGRAHSCWLLIPGRRGHSLRLLVGLLRLMPWLLKSRQRLPADLSREQRLLLQLCLLLC